MYACRSYDYQWVAKSPVAILNRIPLVEDPQVLVHPWVMNERQLRLNANPKAMISEPEPCHNYDKSEMVLKIRH